MSSRRFHVEYAPLSVENLRALPKTVAGQIIRKISRLESGLTGNIKRLRQADFGYRLRMGDSRIPQTTYRQPLQVHEHCRTDLVSSFCNLPSLAISSVGTGFL